MGLELDLAKGLTLFVLGLVAALLTLRLLLRWRHAAVLGRARRMADRLRRPATTLAAVEEQSSAVEDLIEFSDIGAATAAARELLVEDDATIRSAAIEILREIRAIDLWSRDLRRGSYRAKLRAIEALGEVGDERAVAELLEVLGEDDPDVARAASYAIVARDPDYASDRLADALSSPNRRLAETAAATLVRMGEEAVEALVGQLNRPSAQARRLAAESLGNIGMGSVRKLLLPLMETEPEPDVRTAMAEALVRVDGEAAAQDLRRMARSDPDWFVRARAYSLLAEMNAPEASGFLIEGLADLQPDLGQLSEGEDAVEHVSEGPERIRAAITTGLRLLGLSEEEIAAVERRTANSSVADQAEGSEEVLENLAALRDRDAAQRADAARRLGEIGLGAAPALQQALGDPDPLVRAEAARSLGRMGVRESLCALAKVLEDPDANVRLAASTAVRAIITRDAARELTE
ncbi:MAG: HEAT repeat domain-containing protein [Armatimonadota bacterium]|nr:MAG: HEAT repeat domain-containing protein [Armatimonadota bacterium]